MQASCKALKASRSVYYSWLSRAKNSLCKNDFQLKIRAKGLFKESREGLGFRSLMAALRAEGFKIGRYKTRNLMKRLNLIIKQRVKYRVTSKKDSTEMYAPNLIKMDFNPEKINQVWVGDITYLKTQNGWHYLSVVMDLYSRRIIGWAFGKTMTAELVKRSLLQADKLRQYPKNVIFHSDRGSQYSSKLLRLFLLNRGGAINGQYRRLLG